MNNGKCLLTLTDIRDLDQTQSSGEHPLDILGEDLHLVTDLNPSETDLIQDQIKAETEVDQPFLRAGWIKWKTMSNI